MSNAVLSGLARTRPRLRISARAVYLALTVIVISYLTLPPIATVLVASFQSEFLSAESTWTLDNYVQLLTDPTYLSLIVNSLAYGVGTTLCATTLGAILAFLLVRTNIRWKSFIFLSASLPFFIPGLLNTCANIFLFSPKMGMVNHLAESLFGVRPFNLYSTGGMIFVQAVHLTPIAFAMLLGIFRSMDLSLEEAARTSGANDFEVLRQITLKLAAPGLFSAALLIFVETIASFDVPQLVGVPGRIFVFVSQIFDALHSYPQDFGAASTLSMLVMLISVGGISLSYRITGKGKSFATVTGKGFRPQMMKLGRAEGPALVFVSAYFCLAVLLPLATLLWVSLLPAFEQPTLATLSKLSMANYVKVFTMPRILNALTNSLEVTLSTAFIVMGLTTIAAYVTVKTKMPGRTLLDAMIFVPIAIPGTVLGVSVLFWYLLAPLPFSVYGTLAIIVLGFITLYLPYGMRFMAPAMLQISSEMEEAARASGASFSITMLKIYRPLLASSLLGGFLLIFILSFREVSAAVFLFAQGTELFSIAIFDLWGEGLFGLVSALGIVMVVASTLFVLMARVCFGVEIVQAGRVH